MRRRALQLQQPSDVIPNRPPPNEPRRPCDKVARGVIFGLTDWFADKAIELSALPFSGPLYDTLTWGTYRPHLYFGLRARHPLSPLFGLLWYKQPNTAYLPSSFNIRHWCEHGDNVKFLWEDSDGKSFGHQVIEDGGIKFDTDWYNHDNDGRLDSSRSWSARINVHDTNENCVAFIFYLVIEDPQTSLEFVKKKRNNQYHIVSGHSKAFGHFSLNLKLDNGVDLCVKEISHAILNIDTKRDILKIQEVVLNHSKRQSNSYNIELMNNYDYDDKQRANFIAIQLSIYGNSSFEIHYDASDKAIIPPFAVNFDKRLAQFQKKFDKIFPIKAETAELERRYKKMGKVALSNLLGGIGYWYGYAIVYSPFFYEDETRPYGPLSLFSAVPSRPFFPRGFLWDEGFHNLLIQKFDPALTLEIMSSWLDTMNAAGWIPREMILGPEAVKKVPAEFLVQSDYVGNPPVFFFIIGKLMKNKEFMMNHSFDLGKLYFRLKYWYSWFKGTQIGPYVEYGAFQWKGRNNTEFELNPKTLPSGLDDFPRASHPNIQEYHLDLRCWMAVASRVLRTLAEQGGDIEYLKDIDEDVRLFNDMKNLDHLHWSESAQRYSDYGYHSYNVTWVKQVEPGKEKHDKPTYKYSRVANTRPELRWVDDVYGFVNLFPFLLKLLPSNSPKLEIIVNGLNNTKELWTPYGLRSLSANSPYYKKYNTQHDPPYWRGDIWINMNYLALEALNHYGSHHNSAPFPVRQLCQQLYTELKSNVVKNIEKQYHATGFFWEHYDDVNGKGLGTRPFTGWTSLVLRIMADDYD